MSAILNWRTVTHSQHRQFMVKGTVLSRVVCGPRHRYAIEEVRCYDSEGNADRSYRALDAESIGDADIKAGKPIPIVFRCSGIDELEAFLDAAE